MNSRDLEEIEARLAAAETTQIVMDARPGELARVLDKVPALIAEVKRLRAEMIRVGAYAIHLPTCDLKSRDSAGDRRDWVEADRLDAARCSCGLDPDE